MNSEVKFFRGFFVLIFLLLLFSSAKLQAKISQENQKNEILERRHQSAVMKREMPYRIILPAAYNKNKTGRFPVIYLLHGRFGHFNDWTDKTKIAEYATKYNFLIVTPEGGEQGWYIDNVKTPEDKYESYFIQDLIPEIDKNFRTLADRQHRAVAGLSMGGYGAFKFGLKYPEKFVLAGSFSGALDAAMRTTYNASLSQSILDAFGTEGSETRRRNDLFRIVREASEEKIKSFPFLYFDCGTSDHLFEENRNFVALLTEKKVPHEYRQMPGGHTWQYWDAQVQEFLRIADRIVLQNKK